MGRRFRSCVSFVVDGRAGGASGELEADSILAVHADLALYLILDQSDRHAVGEWFYITWLYEVALGIVIGTIIGYSVRKVMKFSERKGLIDRQSFVAQYVSLAILTIGESAGM